MKIDVSQIKAGLSRESSTSKTVAEREKRKREFSADECRIISQRNRRLQRPHSSLWINILRATRRSRDRPKRDPFARGSAQLGSSCEFYDVVSICRSLGVVDPFLRQSDGAAKQFLRSSKRPGFAFTLVSRVYGSHDPDAADLRGHHDDLHGFWCRACQACRFDALRDRQVRVFLPFDEKPSNWLEGNVGLMLTTKNGTSRSPSLLWLKTEKRSRISSNCGSSIKSTHRDGWH